MDKHTEHSEDGRFCYTQITREGSFAIYSQTHKASGIKRYEVVILRIQRAHIWPNGQKVPEQEAYPSPGKWGQDGWTFYSLAAAQAKLNALAQRAIPQEPVSHAVD